MTQFSDNTLHQLAYALVDDSIQYILDSERFNMILNGELDHLPEAAFNLVGTIEEAIEKGEKMIAEATK